MEDKTPEEQGLLLAGDGGNRGLGIVDVLADCDRSLLSVTCDSGSSSLLSQTPQDTSGDVAGHMRLKLAKVLDETVRMIQGIYHEDLVELSFIQSGSLLTEFHAWKRRKSQEMMQALCSGHLDPEDLADINNFMLGHLPSRLFFQSVHPKFDVHSDTGADSEEEEERGLDETSIFKLASEEVLVLKRVMELKNAGLWSTDKTQGESGEGSVADNQPTMSSLAPPSEPAVRVYCDYLFAELRWLAEDFKRERHWKRMSAKKLALSAVKCHREKTERSIRAEKEEAMRIRKHCASVARMIRDWWRQIDKIVHAKHQARLSVKRQQAITTHLGRVLETTEEYTRWLTEGIAGAKTGPSCDERILNAESASDVRDLESRSESNSNSQPAAVTRDPCPDTQPPEAAMLEDSEGLNDSDSEFQAKEEELDAEDDEETIECEENMGPPDGTAQSVEDELAQLAADAACPVENLLPPGYLSPTSPSKRSDEDESTLDGECEDASSDKSYGAGSDDGDDESTIDAQERLERLQRMHAGDKTDVNVSELDEVTQLGLEAEMPLDELLAKIQRAKPDESTESGVVASCSENETSSTAGSDSSPPSGEESDDDRTESTDTDSHSYLKELVAETSASNQEGITPKKEVDHSESGPPNDGDIKPAANQSETENGGNLETLTSEALKAQPTGTTLDSNSSNVTIPFLLTGGTLREYQVVGLAWLAAIYQKRLNGILADEMGLGKTVQTIALIALLACEYGIWGPHLIVVPTSVMLNWEIEFKRWCPGFKILTYFGHAKERKEKRKGWTKTNAFHVCITSYRLAIQDAAVFKRKKWKYLILDEAQNIKNFKSQRWQTLLTFNSQRRLLLTGTPLQNSLMELWSLMHFLMPNIFQSHRDFQEWFASPLTGMIEGNNEYNEQLVARLHKVLRPFLLRRLKADVERQLPKKFEHVIMCRLSRRQRFLYDDFMSMSSTKETLSSGQFLSVMNVLMQLRKVCNHPNLFETRPIISPFHVADYMLEYHLPRLIAACSHPFLVLAPDSNGGFCPVANASAFTEPDLDWLDRAGAAARLLGQRANLAEMARDLPAFVARRCHNLCARTALITAADTIDVVDNVAVQRKKIRSMEQSAKCSTMRRVFLARNVVHQVNEELNYKFRDAHRYPQLSAPTPTVPVVTEVPPPSRPCNAGMPKSVLRSRATERAHCLQLISRINERRCDSMVSNSKTTSDCFLSFGFETQIGPDVVHLVTRMLRRPSLRCKTRCGSVYPGLFEGTLACQRSLYWWPSQDFNYGRSNKLSRVEQAGCLPSDVTARNRSRIGPEAPWARRWFWYHDCLPLRMMLSNPADHLEHLKETLKSFVFVVPSVVSPGFTLKSSCPQYHSQVNGQADRLNAFLSDCLPPACVSPSPAMQRDNRKSTTSSSFIPVSPLAWLMPVQLHQIASACQIQFPDPRLIQYDCGKLQRLDLLLRELKSGSHRVLIFTQMARMLDILEQFLAYHGHRYLRLDGTTKVEQRQVLMERFNQDKNIFVFILSTRSGGLGVNLTGADTVIFYDSDWNPTMDAQAQDRCHRIGQTRDVHIYRLISERTVEENILRKANQKRFLSDVAIEGGRFTTAFFKQNTISELFAEPRGLQDLVSEKQDQPQGTSSKASSLVSNSASTEEFTGSLTPALSAKCVRQNHSKVDGISDVVASTPTVASEAQLAALLEACEDENDRIATKRALDEAKEELAEFDESVPLDESVLPAPSTCSTEEPDPFTQFALSKRQSQAIKPLVDTDANDVDIIEQPCADQSADDSKVVEDSAEQMVERELAEFESALKPIERFGVKRIEEQRENTLTEELVQADAQLVESKETWRLDQLKALYQADEERAEIEEDDMLYCYGDYDPSAQLAELERLEKIIAEEEANESAPQRGRKPQNKSKPTIGTKRKQAKIESSDDQMILPGSAPRASGVAAEEAKDEKAVLGSSRKRKTRMLLDDDTNGLDSSESSLEDVELDIFDGGSLRNRNHSLKHRRPAQEWEFEEISPEQSAHQGRRVSPAATATKRKFPSITFFPRKVPHLDTDVDSHITSPVQEIADYQPSHAKRGRPPGRRGRPQLHALSRPYSTYSSASSDSTCSPGSFSSKRNLSLSKNMALPPVRVIPSTRVSGTSPSATTYDIVREEAVQSHSSLPSSGNELKSRPLTEQGGMAQSRQQLYASANTWVPAGTAVQSPSTSNFTVYQNKFAYGDNVAGPVTGTPSIRSSGLPPASPKLPATYTQWSPNRIPSSSPNIVSTHSYSPKIPPPCTQHPPEPTIPVQSVFNGTRVGLPARQLFTPSGQPVFIITRQMKTPTGEVYQQRFTHPVVPPPQFTKAVRRITHPSGPFQSEVTASPPVSNSTISVPPSIIQVTPSVPVRNSKLPILRLGTPSVSQTIRTADLTHRAEFAPYSVYTPGLIGATPTTFTVLQTKSCGSPAVQLLQPENNMPTQRTFQLLSPCIAYDERGTTHATGSNSGVPVISQTIPIRTAVSDGHVIRVAHVLPQNWSTRQ